MAETYLMAVDLGTSFIKTAVYTADGKLVTQATSPVEQEKLRPGVFIQRADKIFQAVLQCLGKTARQMDGARIEAIAFTGQMAGFMGVDENWGDVTTWSCSLDNRYLPFADAMLKRHADLILDEAGTNCPVMAPKIKWFTHDFPDEAKTIRKYLMIGGYVLGRLGGIPVEEISIDRTYLEWTGLADIRHDRWSEKMLGTLDIDIGQLPVIVPSTHICGRLTPEMAAATGLTAGIPLVSGAGDKPAGCLGAAIVDCGDTILEAGSYGGMSCCVGEYRPDFGNRRLDLIPSAIPGEFYAHYYIAGSGITLDWFVENFVHADAPYEDIEKRAAALPPGTDGLMAIGMLGGCAMPLAPDMRGLWTGFNWSHRSEHFFHSLLESYAFEFATTTDVIDVLYPECAAAPVKVIGGGSRLSLWNQMHADVSGRTYNTIDLSDVALWGACIVAGKAVGVFADMKETAKRHVHVTRSFRCDPAKHATYRPLMERYKRLLAAAGPVYAVGTEKS